ncbi:MAG: SET domain-containing protein [Alcaligenaceae bacterium]|nr:SET domain-containing protein [Alcaligenaceae bacterium]
MHDKKRTGTNRNTSPLHVVRDSPLHGKGVFAAHTIPAGTVILDYRGLRISPEEADARHPVNPDDPWHTFYFSLSSGQIIDGGRRGNDARWINHSCTPNCEAQENTRGTRVFIVALRDIAEGEELFFDYGLVLDGRITRALRDAYRCLCGTADCRGTMLTLPKRARRSTGRTNPTKQRESPDSQ